MNFNELIKKYDIPMNEDLKSAIDSVTSIQAKEISDGTKEYNELEFLKATLYRMYSNDYEMRTNQSLGKVYVLLDNSIWDDEDYTKVVCVSFDKEMIKKAFKEYVEYTKKDMDYEHLEFSKDGIDDGFVVDEDDESFSIYENGEYNSFHCDISIIEQNLLFDKEENIEYGNNIAVNNDNQRDRELLIKCISYINSNIESYSDMIDTFKKLGFTNEELTNYDIRDFDFESEVDYEL